MYDLVVIGGGIVGTSAAYHAARAGAKTLLVDRNDQGKASLAGAGILAPEMSGIDSDDWFRLAIAAVDYYPELVAQLQAGGVAETGYAPASIMMVAVTPDEDEAYALAQQRMILRQQRYGRPAAERLRDLDSTSARQLFPALAPIRQGLHFQDAGRVDAHVLMRALHHVAQHYSLHVRQNAVDQVITAGERVTGVIVDGERISAGAVLIAGGAWSPALAAQLHCDLPVIPQRGQIIHLRLPDVDTSEWPVVVAFHGHYILPWPDSRVVVGATREQIGYAPYATAIGIHEVLAEAMRVAPGLADAALSEVRVGLRPGSPDLLPMLGPVPGWQNAFVATGHGATGLQLGPYSGKLVAEQALGQASALDLAAFGCGRFGEA